MNLSLLLCMFTILAAPVWSKKDEKAPSCPVTGCDISKNCRCSSAAPVISKDQLAKYPQLISIVTDDAVKEELYTNIWLKLSTTYTNPDDNTIICTFFVPHEYSNYKRVNDLFNFGHEIAVNSITKDPHQSYWRNATEDVLFQEFGGMKKILEIFANIPPEQIIGVRTPELQLAGNSTISAYMRAGLKYDSSWPTLPSIPLFPYTLDYASTQQCTLGSRCPNEAFPGFWILPINDLNGLDHHECNVLYDCNITGTADQISKWLLGEVDRVRTTTKVPLTLTVNSGWFEYTKNAMEGFELFLSEVTKNRKDVFFVSQTQVMEWTQNPVTLDKFKTRVPSTYKKCLPRTCELNKDNEVRLMVSCTTCPKTYPWLGNPEGK